MLRLLDVVDTSVRQNNNDYGKGLVDGDVFNQINERSVVNPNDDNDNCDLNAWLQAKHDEIKRWMVKFPASALPINPIAQIFSFLPPNDIPNIRLVCKMWRDIVDRWSNSLPKITSTRLEMNIVNSDSVTIGQGSSNRLDFCRFENTDSYFIDRSQFAEIQLRLQSSTKLNLSSQTFTRAILDNSSDSGFLWNSTSIKGLLRDPRFKHIIFNGEIFVSFNFPVASFLYEIKAIALEFGNIFRPSGLSFSAASFESITEEQLLNMLDTLCPYLQTVSIIRPINIQFSKSVLKLLERRSIHSLTLDFGIRVSESHVLQTQDIIAAIKKWQSGPAVSKRLRILDHHRMQVHMVSVELRGEMLHHGSGRLMPVFFHPSLQPEPDNKCLVGSSLSPPSRATFIYSTPVFDIF